MSEDQLAALRHGLEALSGNITIASLSIYAYAMLGKTKPMIMTWLIWSCVDTVLYAGMHREGAANDQIYYTMACSWIVTVLSFYYGEWKWKTTDKICMVIGAISIGLLFTAKSGTPAIIIACFANIVGVLPTIRSAWDTPSDECLTAWILSLCASILSSAAISAFVPEKALQPLTFLSISGAVLLTLLLTKFKKTSAE